ncbi:CbtB domain-containing protein [Pseudooceanicola algae]|uniref:Uncharacterized protein n=1 Tax=Pseudooceanicola algae TaxID=1537215 RepID=A0A418SKK6_9RHOB|nr:CbtB domain-containing protein [Pseudooceanicola algae]QPM91041.1 hypothetical protein PSAL_022840 [Pseudooceanicola algae]
MTTQVQQTTTVGAKNTSSLLAPVAAILIGASVVMIAGFSHAETLHDAAHDVRHATGFPCH